MATFRYDPNCVKCGGTGRYDEWAETTTGLWFLVDTRCGCLIPVTPDTAPQQHRNGK